MHKKHDSERGHIHPQQITTHGLYSKKECYVQQFFNQSSSHQQNL